MPLRPAIHPPSPPCHEAIRLTYLNPGRPGLIQGAWSRCSPFDLR